MVDKLVSWLINVDEDKIFKRASIWNMVGSFLNAGTSAVLSFFIMRLCGMEEAGIFSIASAIAYQCLSLGNFGVRNFQSTDVKKEYEFNDYFYFRIFSMILMTGLLFFYSFLSGYTLEKAIVVFSFGVFKCVDVIEDLYHGEYHRNHRLDIAAILSTIRYIISLVLFILILFIFHNLSLACILSAIATFMMFLVPNMKLITFYFKGKYKFYLAKFKTLLFMLLPIMISNYIKLYIVNSPKYAIDQVLGDEVQAYFNVLMMPVFVISLLSDVVFRPFLTSLSEYWNNKFFSEFKKTIIRQLFFIAIITGVVVIGGVVIGLTLLEIIFGVKLHSNMLSFIILLLGGGLTTLSGFLCVVLTIQREQNKMAIGNAISLIICLIFANTMVAKYEILGASLLYLIVNLIPVIYFSIIIIKRYKSEKKLNDELER